jgi:hypothetical protein
MLSSLMNAKNVDNVNTIFVLTFEVRLRTHAPRYKDEIVHVRVLTYVDPAFLTISVRVIPPPIRLGRSDWCDTAVLSGAREHGRD